MLITDIAIRRPVTTLLGSFALVFFGFFALISMGVDRYPEVDFPNVSVTTILEGADPEIMDQDVTDVIEEQLKTIEGVKTIRSVSSEGRSQIIVEFLLTKDVNVGAEEVRAKINVAQADLPAGIEQSVVDKVDISSQPIMWIAVTSPGDYREVATYADKVLRQRLQSVSGVGAIVMRGFRDREVRIWLEPSALEARNLTPLDVANAVAAKHIELPGGRIEQAEKEFSVKVKGEYESIEELEGLVIFEEEGSLVRLRDVATVTDGSEDLRSIARFNSIPAIGLGIRKQSGTNTVAVAKAVRETLANAVKDAPPGVEVHVAHDTSDFIERDMNDVLRDLLIGAFLTSLVMLLFLRNFRMTFISITAIPTSIVGCFMVMYALGFTINTMTLLAMSLSIGIVIDDAIVVLENIFRHVEKNGATPMEAAHIGTSEVGFAVIAASSTIVAVFVPVAFMRGLIGRFFFEFGLSVAVAVLISIVVSFTLTPMLCSRLLRHDPNHGIIFRSLENAFQFLERTYGRLLDISLRHRWVTLAMALGCFIGGLSLLPVVKKTFFNQGDESRFMIRFEFPAGTSIQKTDSGVRQMEQLVFAHNEVVDVFTTIGGEGSGINEGLLTINLLRRHERDITQQALMSQLRDELKETVPEALISVEGISPMGSSERNSDLQYIVKGPTVDELMVLASAVRADLDAIPGFVDVDTNLRLDKPEVSVEIDRDFADDLGVDVRTIAQNVGILFGGTDVGTFKEGGNRYDIRLRANPNARLTPEDLYRLSFRSQEGDMIRTPNLIKIHEGMGPNTINRFNRSRSFTLYANLDGGLDLGRALAAVEASVENHMPDAPGWSTDLTGRSQYFTESFKYLLYAMAVSIVLIYLIMGSLFESFIHPFTILMSVPLAAIGGLGLLVIWDKFLDMYSFIGFIMLIGIVTKNAILLVDVTNQQRAKGMPRDEALRRAGPLRLRPILMTALTTMAAILPIALGLSEGGEQRSGMGAAIIGGMFTSTFLTLLVIPSFYTVMDDLQSLVGRVLGRKPSSTLSPLEMTSTK